MSLLNTAERFNETALGTLEPFEGIAPLLLRIYLAPIMMQAGWNKLVGFDDPEYQEIATEKQAPDTGSEYEAASAEMFMYAAKLADRTRSHPRNDLRPDS